MALATLAAPGLAAAQAAPDAGSLMRESARGAERPAPPAPTAEPAPSPASASATAPADNGVRFTLQRFVLQGVSLVPEPALQALLAPWLGRPIGFADLQRAGDALVAEYRQRGWLARVLVPTQEIADGAVVLQITEARLGSVRVDADGPLSLQPAVIVGTLTARQQPGEPIRFDHLDRAANLLGDMPGVATAVSLVPGTSPGTSDVVVKALDKPALSGLVQLDNHGSRSVGEARLSAGLQFDNPRGVGDQALLHGALTEGSAYLRAGYWLPVGYDGARVGVAASAMGYRLLREFRALDARGSAQTLSFYGRYPLVRSATRNVTLNAALDLRHYRDHAGGVESDDKQVRALSLGAGGDHTDAHGGGGFTQWDATATLGHLGLGGNAVHAAADRAGPATAGGYGKVGFNLARLQRLLPATTLWAGLSGQLAANNLDSSEQFSLGGPNGVRAYPALEGQGDSGLTATVELRQQVSRPLQLTAFFDAGQVRRRDNPQFPGAPVPHQLSLKGWGLGANWTEPGRYSLRLSLARRIGRNPAALPSGDDSDGSLRRTRFWLAGTVYF